MIISGKFIKWVTIIMAVLAIFIAVVRFAKEIGVVGENPEADTLTKDQLGFFGMLWRSFVIEGTLLSSGAAVLNYFCMTGHTHVMGLALMLGIASFTLRMFMFQFMLIDCLVLFHIFMMGFLYINFLTNRGVRTVGRVKSRAERRVGSATDTTDV